MGHVDDQVLQETITQIYTDWVEESRRTLYEGNDWQQNRSIDRPPQRADFFRRPCEVLGNPTSQQFRV